MNVFGTNRLKWAAAKEKKQINSTLTKYAVNGFFTFIEISRNILLQVHQTSDPCDIKGKTERATGV